MFKGLNVLDHSMLSESIGSTDRLSELIDYQVKLLTDALMLRTTGNMQPSAFWRQPLRNSGVADGRTD